MANPRIDVEISSNIDQLKRGFSESEATVTAFANRIGQLTKKFDESNGTITLLKNRLGQLKENLEKATDIRSIAKYNIRIQETESELKRLGSVGLQVGNNLNRIGGSALSAAPKFQKLGGSIGNANGVAIEFSRIIQDAPFGIIGIGNNIQQLTQNFATLKTTTGSTGSALKASLGALVTPANLLVIGISVLTSAFVVLQQKGFFNTKKEAKTLKEELEKYVETLDGVAAASLKGAQNAQKEIATLTGLRLQIENVNLSQEDRLAAVDEIQKKYPAYFGNLSKEKILAGEVGDSYQRLTTILLNKSKADAFLNKIATNSIELLTIETRLQEIRNKRLGETSILEAKLGILQKKRIDQGFLTQGDIAEFERTVSALNKANGSREEEVTLLESKLNLSKQNITLENEVNDLIGKGTLLIDGQGKAVEKTLTAFEKFSIVAKDLNEKFFIEGAENARLFNEQLAETNRLTASIESVSGNILAGQLKDESIANQGGIQRIDVGVPDTAPIIEVADVFAENLNRIKLQVEDLQGAFAGLGSLIGKAFNNPGLGQFVGQFIGFAAKLIAANFSIATSSAIAGASNAALATGPAAPITLPAFIAGAVGLIGAAFAAIGGGGGSRGGGGGVGASSGASSQSFGGSGLESPFLTGLDVGGTIEIDGTKLLVVLNNASKKRNRG